MKKKFITITILLILIVIGVWIIDNNKFDNKVSNNTDLNITKEETEKTIQTEKKNENFVETKEEHERESRLDIETKIELVDVDGNGSNYYFEYNGEKFTAIYTYDNWKIIDSYKIKNRKDMAKICQALLDEHKIHGKDFNSYRTAEDMVYEWVQHNIAYKFFSEDNEYKLRVKDVDFDPEDQGRNMIELYNSKGVSNGTGFFDTK